MAQISRILTVRYYTIFCNIGEIGGILVIVSALQKNIFRKECKFESNNVEI